jgi:hypothetical protein
MLYSSEQDNYYVNKYNYKSNNYIYSHNKPNNKYNHNNFGRRCFGNCLLLIPIGYCGILFYMYINS